MMKPMANIANMWVMLKLITYHGEERSNGDNDGMAEKLPPKYAANQPK